MASDGRINIYITEGDGENSISGNSIEGSGRKSKLTDDEKLSKAMWRFAEHQIFSFIRQEAKQVINHYVSNYGDRTGDYVTQKNTQMGISVASKAIGIGAATMMGAKYGPIGAAIGFGVTTTTTVLSGVFEYENMLRKISIQNKNIELLKTRSGLNSLNDGSRGTDA